MKQIKTLVITGSGDGLGREIAIKASQNVCDPRSDWTKKDTLILQYACRVLFYLDLISKVKNILKYFHLIHMI